MYKKILLVILLLGVKGMTYGQKEVFVSATNKSMDGYITVGGLYNGWGVYLGAPYNDRDLVSQKTGSLSSQMKFGLLKTIRANKIMMGAGIQPVNYENKINAFIAYNPLKSTDMKLWLIGNVTSSTFTPGLGLSYNIK
jgi:hypothetical protein